jgi:hypothetical protein
MLVVAHDRNGQLLYLQGVIAETEVLSHVALRLDQDPEIQWVIFVL